MAKLYTLCTIYQGNQILLGMKKRGFGVGRWNGFGGKVEDDETLEEAAKREILEESGLTVGSLEKMGVLYFEFEDETPNKEVYIFRTSDFSGEPQESEEMRPKWFDNNNLPLNEMWPADALWLPVLLEGKKFEGRYTYDQPSTSNFASSIIKQELILT
jgi:8-oxo-dGTP diphosphatase/2-hydroxy-dATP diphosphatase